MPAEQTLFTPFRALKEELLGKRRLSGSRTACGEYDRRERKSTLNHLVEARDALSRRIPTYLEKNVFKLSMELYVSGVDTLSITADDEIRERLDSERSALESLRFECGHSIGRVIGYRVDEH